jgi:hypothetical protein
VRFKALDDLPLDVIGETIGKTKPRALHHALRRHRKAAMNPSREQKFPSEKAPREAI